jgi:cytochrome c556
MKPGALAGSAAVVAVLLAACSPDPRTAWSKPDPDALTIQQVMTAKVDPSADALWGAVATAETAAGVEVREPRTDADWKGLRQQALAIVEGAKLLQSPRRVSANGVLDDGAPPGARTTQQIQQDIAADHEGFIKAAQGLEASARQTLAAIDARNAPALLSSTAQLDAICDVCHEKYWFPHAKPVVMPPESELTKTENRPDR